MKVFHIRRQEQRRSWGFVGSGARVAAAVGGRDQGAAE
jgi:hypothetical protein